MKKILFAFVFALMFISLASAVDEVYQQNNKIEIIQPCFNNGTYCSTNAVCNVSITYPNSSLMFNNEVMDNQISYHNFSIPATATSIIGEYDYDITCCDGEDTCAAGSFEFLINPSGEQVEGLTSLGLILACILLAFGMFWVSTFFAKEQQAIKTLLICFGFGFMILGMQIAKVSIAGKNFLSGLASTGLTITIVLFWLLLSYYLIIYTKNLMIKLKEVKRKKKERRFGVEGWM